MKRETELRWPDLLNIYLWHRYGTEFVQDDTAYVALLRVTKFVEFAIEILEGQPVPPDKTEE